MSVDLSVSDPSSRRCVRCGYELVGLDREATCPMCALPAQLSRCVRCGYDLVGLEIEATCPECALPIRLSSSDAGLRYADADYLRRIRVGALVAALGIFLWIFSSIVELFIVQLASAGTANAILRFLASGTSFTGWILMTSHDPSGVVELRFRFKNTLRILVFVCLILEVGELLYALSSVARPHLDSFGFGPLGNKGPVGIITYALWSLVGLARSFVTTLFMRELASILGNRELAQMCSHLLWIIPLMWTVFALCLFIGPMISTALVLIVLGRICVTAHRILRAQEQMKT